MSGSTCRYKYFRKTEDRRALSASVSVRYGRQGASCDMKPEISPILGYSQLACLYEGLFLENKIDSPHHGVNGLPVQ